MNNALLLVDMQNDFCTPEGSLYIPGSVENCTNTARFIQKNSEYIHSIYATFDCHCTYHIAHAVFWRDANGNIPPDYTEITYADYSRGKYRPVDPSVEKRVEKYLQELEARGRYSLILWPPHCLMGSYGMMLEKQVWEAGHAWELSRPMLKAHFIMKSLNAYTEHYSVLQSEVPDPDDPSTHMNFYLINRLKRADRIIVAGEALSHCLGQTIRDLTAYIPPSSFVLLTDCTAPVAGFEKYAKLFVEEMGKRGMQCMKSTELNLADC